MRLQRLCQNDSKLKIAAGQLLETAPVSPRPEFPSNWAGDERNVSASCTLTIRVSGTLTHPQPRSSGVE